MVKQEVRPGIWRISFEWRANPQARTNEVYVINGQEKTLIVDTSKPEVVPFDLLLEAIDSTGAHLANAEVVLTHRHLDHVGNANGFINAGFPVFALEQEPYAPCNEVDSSYFLDLAGVPELHRDCFSSSYIEMSFCHDLNNGAIFHIEDSACVNVAPFNFLVVETPGHSLDSCCLYDPDSKVLLAGDTIAAGFIPPVNTTMPDMDKIDKYAGSLCALQALDVDLCLTGHGNPIAGREDYKAQISAIQGAYRRRLNKSFDIVRNAEGVIDAYTLADVYLSGRGKRSDVSKYYYVSHISMMLSYLEYLYEQGLAARQIVDGRAQYCLNRYASCRPLFRES